jgi:hypothetical protein
MAMVWGRWLFGSDSHLAQMMADWMALDAFIVLSGGWVRGVVIHATPVCTCMQAHVATTRVCVPHDCGCNGAI